MTDECALPSAGGRELKEKNILTLKEQHHRAACDRNLKQDYHGVLVKDFSIIYDEYKSKYKAVITLQLPFFDISPEALVNWVFATYPQLRQYVTNYDTCTLFNLQMENMVVKVTYLGRDRYSPSCQLFDIKICIVDYAYSYANWNMGTIQHFIDVSCK